MKTLRLSLDLVPASAWSVNLRSILTPKMWNEIRSKVIRKANGKCTVCGVKSDKLHAHEVWRYDDENKIQKLEDIIALCYLCHGVKHFGYSSLKGNKEIFIRHFMKVNGCDRTAFQKALTDENQKFDDRSHYEWQLDLEKLKDYEK